jgi:hypothetical protein
VLLQLRVAWEMFSLLQDGELSGQHGLDRQYTLSDPDLLGQLKCAVASVNEQYR